MFVQLDRLLHLTNELSSALPLLRARLCQIILRSAAVVVIPMRSKYLYLYCLSVLARLVLNFHTIKILNREGISCRAEYGLMTQIVV